MYICVFELNTGRKRKFERRRVLKTSHRCESVVLASETSDRNEGGKGVIEQVLCWVIIVSSSGIIVLCSPKSPLPLPNLRLSHSDIPTNHHLNKAEKGTACLSDDLSLQTYGKIKTLQHTRMDPRAMKLVQISY